MATESESGKTLDPNAIEGWHAHVYFDEASRDPAQSVRDAVTARFSGAMEMGRWHEKLVGPHPRWSYQIAFAPDAFDTIIPWLALNRQGLTVFIHPETGDALTDHRDRAIWMGEVLPLNLDIFRKDGD